MFLETSDAIVFAHKGIFSLDIHCKRYRFEYLFVSVTFESSMYFQIIITFPVFEHKHFYLLFSRNMA